MDTSDEYIKMCRNAKEIQEMRQRGASGEIVKDKNDFTVAFYPSEKDRINHMEIDDYWLPRQDQLQDMVKYQIKNIHKDSFGYKLGSYPEGFICLCLMTDFETFIDSEYQYIDYIGFNSMEQLWLIYVMDKMYNRRWNGLEWIVR